MSWAMIRSGQCCCVGSSAHTTLIAKPGNLGESWGLACARSPAAAETKDPPGALKIAPSKYLQDHIAE